MASGLLRSADSSLPNELAFLIIDHLTDDRQTLCALAQTCSNLQYLAEDRLYKTIHLLSVKDLHAIIAAFTNRPARVRAVQTLRILYQYRQNDLNKSADSRTAFNEFVAQMVHLRAWHIESPYDNFHWEKAGGDAWVERDMERFRRALEQACNEGPKETERIASARGLGQRMERTVGLALLQDLTIHSHGATADFWNLDGFHCLFRHPALRSLHISCITLPPNEIPELSSHVRTSPLTTLVFDECELSQKSLLSILRTPARLKNLTLGENVYNINRTRGIEPVLSMNPTASLETLSAVAHSLESLTHFDPAWRIDTSPNVLRSIRPIGEGMRNFDSLRYLECDTSSFLHQAVIMNRDLAPPSLDTLRVRRHWEVQTDFWDQPPDIDHYLPLPSLNTLELMQLSFLWHDYALSGYICDAERLRNRHAKAYRLSKAGINLRMLIEMHRDPALIPPYLQDERVPIVECIYDASEEGFHRHIVVDEPETAQPEPYFSGNHGTPYDDDDEWNSPARSPSPQPSANRAVSPSPDPVPSAPPPETDQLNTADIQRIASSTRRLLDALKRRFVSRNRRPSFWDVSMSSDDGIEEDSEYYGMGDLEVDDLEEQEDMALEMELDDLEELEDEFEDEGGVHVYEHEGELYIEVYESETGSEGESDEEGSGGGGGGGGPGGGATMHDVNDED
ncbi:hypothetical protein LEMA_P012890.1 [Plenodomus lingam JN3]|uniref:F-box domain-containing protein n=1 Tax=Leptosphaeria maculans (strain JN3 / isolate v23.1.3 / race Av1-4-5-6-7-8) TaxID=985895 RepID=E5AC48_LEPMJ|nr:hypothetical protein LEMA_P012890.1 [Plenodomus lingam JN3]CBY00159.1 hypothetical protein LEMA_P012890.1 [Plenodomus lingam JN3]